MTTPTALAERLDHAYGAFASFADGYRCDSIIIALQTALKAAAEGHEVPGRHRVMFGVMVGQLCQMARGEAGDVVDEATRGRALVLIDAVQKSCVLTLLCMAHDHGHTHAPAAAS